EVAILDSGTVRAVATPEELKGRGADRIVVELRDPPATVPDLLADDDRVDAVDLDGHRLVVTAREGGLVAPDLVRQLDREGLEIVDLEIARTSLEEIFVEMTRTAESDATPAERASDSVDEGEKEQPVAPDGGRKTGGQR
ncbi:MAG: DUF4162 domain-containing protein, partial [Halohasta sp.]